MRIAISGSSGLIGTALAPSLAAAGHDVVRLVRRPAGDGEIRWDPAAGGLAPADLTGVDAVINLSGVGIGDHRWTDAHKQAVLDSRVDSTSLLARTMAAMADPPQVLLSASAIGFYGDSGSEVLTEDSPAGTGFVAEVCVPWEGATQPATDAGIRTVMLRTGLVMSPKGGILERMLLPYKLGVGGRIGSGEQYWSWIDLTDHLRAVLFLVESDLSGPVNLTAPNPLPFSEVVAIVGRVLRRPTFMPTPRFALETMLGKERARALLFEGQRVIPARLLEAGFTFSYPTFEDSLRHVLDA